MCAPPVRSRLALAEAVSAQPAGWRLDPDNRVVARAPVAELVDADAPFAVVPRAGLLVLDVDLTGLSAAAATGRQGVLDRLVAAAVRGRVPYVLTASGRPGHRHAFFLVGSGPDRVLLESACRAAGLDVRTRGIRPPLAAHRLGGRATLLFPVSPQDAAVALSGPVPARAAAVLAAALGRRLSVRVDRALRAGHAAGGYASASEARMALAVQCAARGLTADDLARLLEDPRHPLGASFRDRPARWRRRELDRLWTKAAGWVATHPVPPRPAPDRPEEVAAASARAAWPGMAGASDLAVLETLLALAGRLGRVTVAASLPELAVGAGVSTDTARAASRRLVAAGWLTVAAEATATTSRTYRLQVPPDLPDAAPSAISPASGSVWADLGADVGRWGALGKSTLRVARLLTGAPAATADLAARLRLSPNAVRIHLRRLCAHGVAVRAGAGWALTGADPEHLAAVLGVAGRGARQRDELAATRAERAALRGAWRREVSVLRRNLGRELRGEAAAGGEEAGSVLPPRVVAAHRSRLLRGRPAFAAEPAAA